MGANLNILLVDDEQLILDLGREMLQHLGHRVTIAAGADDARAALRSGSFEVLFLDQFLGADKGLDLLHEVRAAAPETSVIMMSAAGSAELAAEAMQRGAADFLVKPFFESDAVRSLDYVSQKREICRRQRTMMAEMEQRIRETTDELVQVNFSVLASFARAMEKKDLGTYGHSVRVSRYAAQIAETMQLPAAVRNDLDSAALLHDIGKIGISDMILGKKGPLTDQEMAELRRHPDTGVVILKPLKHYRSVLPAIQYHHEHFDGSGYPHGLSGEEIPLLARIIAIANTYDAIVTDRPYRPAANHDRALAIVQQRAGSHFDPVIVRAFLVSFDRVTHCRAVPA